MLNVIIDEQNQVIIYWEEGESPLIQDEPPSC